MVLYLNKQELVLLLSRLNASNTNNEPLQFVLPTGAVAIAVANPTDLVKVRLQAEGKLPPGVPRRYSGSLNAYSTIMRQVCGYNPICLLKRKMYFILVYFSSSLFLFKSASINRKELGLFGLGLAPILPEMLSSMLLN